MSDLNTVLKQLTPTPVDIAAYYEEVRQGITSAGYSIVEENVTKPWGAYFRIESTQAEGFIADFFPGLTLDEARLGIDNAELSPKILVVAPGQRLSWQYHHRRAERWCFLTRGGYRRSLDDTEGVRQEAQEGEVVQFATSERHRLEGDPSEMVLVAEIWQHSDPQHPSDEDDIVRVQDDYKR